MSETQRKHKMTQSKMFECGVKSQQAERENSRKIKICVRGVLRDNTGLIKQ